MYNTSECILANICPEISMYALKWKIAWLLKRLETSFLISITFCGQVIEIYFLCKLAYPHSMFNTQKGTSSLFDNTLFT